MYKIALAPEQKLPDIDRTIMQLLIFPRLQPESKLLICYIIREHLHNPVNVLTKIVFLKTIGIKRRACDNAFSELFDKNLLEKYSNEKGEVVYTLDWNGLLELLRDNTMVIKAGRSRFYREENGE